MEFLKDYLHYNSGNESPENYHIWSMFAILASAVSRRIWVHQGYYLVHPNLYICLVGSQGGRKTTAKDQAYDVLREALHEEVPVSAESMSKESMTQFMSKDENMRVYKDPVSNQPIEYRPFTIFSTELKNFLSINPITIIDFLTTIYDRKFYDVITKNKGTDVIVNPNVVFLSCETPEWIRERLKQQVISGGFSRRMIWVYETEERERIPFPEVTMEQAKCKERCIAHLRKLWSLVGQFDWTPDAKAFYGKWYKELRISDDPIMAGFDRSVHIQLLKISMLLECCKTDMKLVLQQQTLELGLELIDKIRPNMLKLSEGSGLNKLAGPGQKIIDWVRGAGGHLPEMTLKKEVFRDLGGRDFNEVLYHYLETRQLFRLKQTIKGVERSIIATKEGMEQLKTQPPQNP